MGRLTKDGSGPRNGTRGERLPIRPFRAGDETGMAEMIAATLRVSNKNDYAPEYIEEMVRRHSPAYFARRAEDSHFYVVCDGEEIVGCGGITGYRGGAAESYLLSVFVRPAYQGRGVGRRIVGALEADEFFLRARRTELGASVTAVGFWRKMGYSFKDGASSPDGDGVVRMEKYKKKRSVTMDFYLSKNGKEGNPGTREAPFASPEEARDAVRAYLADPAHGSVTVHVGAGEYRTAGIVLDERDSGTADAPVVWEGEDGALFNGGMALDPASFGPLTEEEKSRLHGDARSRVVRCDLTALGLTREDWGELCAIGSYSTGGRYDGAVLSPMWCELFVNGVRQEIARYPNEGFLITGEPVREGRVPECAGGGKPPREEWMKVHNPFCDIYTVDEKTARRTAGWRSMDGVWMFGYPKYGWADMSSPVVSVDPETCQMETAWISGYGMKPNAPYYFYNVFEELDAPGEWFLDRERGLLYLYPAVPLESAEINLSLLTGDLLRIGNGSYITLKNLSFTGTRGDALDLSGTALVVEDCTICNVAGWAIRLNGKDCAVRGCEISRTGRGGVFVSGGDRAALIPSGNVVENNHIHHIAEIFRTYNPAVQLTGIGAVVRHNEIHDSAHAAILFRGNEHRMEYNEIYGVCKIADDSSAIYAGRDYCTCGNVVYRNYFHDMESDADNHIGIFGMYCDDNLGSCEMVQNVFVRCQSALLLHGGHDMTFCGNVILGACPKSKYSVRFHRYGYCDDLVPGGDHARGLDAVPWQSEIWRRAYPHIAEYLTWDPDTEQGYPHYCDVSGNVVIGHKPMDVNFPWDDPRFHNRMENNTVMETAPTDDVRLLCEKILPETVPGFAPIPFGEIGRKKKNG